MSGTAPPPLARPIYQKDFSRTYSKFKTTVYSDVPVNARNVSHTHNVRTLAWNPLGTLVATGALDRTLRIWNPERPNVKHSTELKGHQGGIEKVAFHPAKVGELASASSDGAVKFWDVRSKNSVAEVKAGDSPNLFLSWQPQGNGLLVGTKDDELIPIDYAMMRPMGSYKQPVQTNQTAFTWPGNHVLMTCGDGTLKLVSWPDMQPVHSVTAQTTAAYAIDLAPNGDFLAIGGSDSLVTLWDYTGWICKRSFNKMTGPVRSISFSFDSCYVVGGSDEGNGLEIAHVYSGEYVHKIETKSPAPQVAWSPRSYALAYAGDSGAKLSIIGDFEAKMG